MKYQITYMVLLLAFNIFHALAQPTEANEVFWDADQSLNWEDFKGTPEVTSNFSAVSATYIETTHGCSENGSFAYQVRAAFVKDQSWTRDVHSQDLLEHEQLHFDLTEYFARKMRHELGELVSPCDKPLEKIKIKIDSLYAQMEHAHQLYDIYTQHGLDHQQQGEWEDYIAKKLKKLNKYQDATAITPPRKVEFDNLNTF